jgi:WD40 repeat protein
MPDATYHVQNKFPCDPGTRKQLLEEIVNWICDISENSPSFFWLSGDPGVGKSAVTASTAQECKRRKILWAQFFINRNDASTTDPQLYFPSIVKQMSEHNHSVGNAIQNILKEQPDYMKDEMALQARELFLRAVRVASKSDPGKPVAIVIDALDETDIKRLNDTAEIFSRILVDLPRNVKVFISSRVENVIRNNFAPHPRVRNIHLSAGNSIEEVTQFLEAKVRKIMAEYEIKWSEWGQERMRKLCSQASGLFIWAVTAIEYIRSEIEESGRECLDVVLDELNENGMDNINMLYWTILKRTSRNETDAWQTQRFRRIVGAILVQQTPLSIADLQGLLDLKNPKTGKPVDVEHFVRRLRTLLVPGVGEITGRTIPRVHKSFADFITIPKAGEFRVDVTESHGELALQSIRRLVHLWPSRDEELGELPTQLRYTASHWSSHLTRVFGVPVEAEETDDDAASSSDASSLASTPETDPGASVPVDPGPTKKHKDRTPMLSACVSPDGSRIAYARGNSVLLRDIETGNFISGPFNGHTDDINSATFSPDGRYVLTASDDRSIRVWDVETGEMVRNLEGHTAQILSTTFSPDGSQIVSASLDRSIRIWNAQTGEMHTLNGHTSGLYSALFSPDARYIVSASSDKTVRVWDASTGEAVHIFDDHSTAAVFAFFSPDGKHILSCSDLGIIIVWDFESRQIIPNGCIDAASLSFIDSGSSPYIIIPPKSNTTLQNTASSLSSYSFRVAGGIAGGISNTWIYINPDNQFMMKMHLGQLILNSIFVFH